MGVGVGVGVGAGVGAGAGEAVVGTSDEASGLSSHSVYFAHSSSSAFLASSAASCSAAARTSPWQLSISCCGDGGGVEKEVVASAVGLAEGPLERAPAGTHRQLLELELTVGDLLLLLLLLRRSKVCQPLSLGFLGQDPLLFELRLQGLLLRLELGLRGVRWGGGVVGTRG